MDVIIVGCGKGGSLHKNAYLQLQAEKLMKGRLFFIDKNKQCSWGEYDGPLSRNNYFSEKVYKSIDALLADNPNMVVSNVIVHICLPVGTMLTTIQYFKQLGFRNFVVEKPFVFYKENKINPDEVLKDLNILIVENYLFSLATRYANDIINKYDLQVNMVITEFSKNRRNHSAQNRGFSSPCCGLTVWEIEVPHQLYVCNFLFGKVKHILCKDSSDMIINDLILKNHRSGLLVCNNYKQVIYVIKSNLENDKICRTIDAVFDDNYKLNIFYYLEDSKLQGLSSGCTLTRLDKVIETIVFDNDNNMYEMIRNYYDIFLHKKKWLFKTIPELLEYSAFMNELVNK